MGDQTISVDSMSDAVRSPEENASMAEETASVSENTEQTAETQSVTPSEEKSNTTDNVTGEQKSSEGSIPYSRFSEVVAEKNQYKAKAEMFDKIQSDPQYASQLLQQANPNAPVSQEQQVKAKLQELGIPDSESVQKMVQEAIQQDRVYREIDAKVAKLSNEWNGKDGKPKFDVEEIVEYGQKTGIYDPEAAFEVLHSKELAEYRAKQAKTGVKSERQGKPVQNVGRDEDALVKEARKTGDWTKVLQGRL